LATIRSKLKRSCDFNILKIYSKKQKSLMLLLIKLGAKLQIFMIANLEHKVSSPVHKPESVSKVVNITST
jgi:hypothetical protein